MTVREYIGARYVPLFADPIQWDNTKAYEPLTIVSYEGNSYTSRQYVPEGIAITNNSYWALTGNYNAQIEAYRAEVQAYDGRIDSLEGMLPDSEFDSSHTVKDAIDSINEIIPSSDFDSSHTIKDAIDSINEIIPSSEFDSENTVKDAIDALGTALSDAVADIEDLEAQDKLDFSPLSIYVATSGSDDNDGLSIDNPIRNLDKAFAYYKKGFTNLLINIIEAGTYHTTANNLLNVTNHIYSTVSGVTVVFDNQLRCYNTYIDFASANTINIEMPAGFHNDAVDLYLLNTRLTVDVRFDFTAGSVTVGDGCTIITSARITLFNAQVYLVEGATVSLATTSAALSNLVYSANSMITCSATLNVTVPTGFTNPYFRFERSILIYSASSISLTNLSNITYALILRASFAIIHNSVYTSVGGSAKINNNYSIIQAKSASTIFE